LELIEQYGRLWGKTPRGMAERLPQVHHRQANLPTFLGNQIGKELVHAFL
jgi:hypothetical protein